eukprot:4631225-Pyramimonas_sp.AAC.1
MSQQAMEKVLADASASSCISLVTPQTKVPQLANFSAHFKEERARAAKAAADRARLKRESSNPDTVGDPQQPRTYIEDGNELPVEPAPLIAVGEDVRSSSAAAAAASSPPGAASAAAAAHAPDPSEHRSRSPPTRLQQCGSRSECGDTAVSAFSDDIGNCGAGSGKKPTRGHDANYYIAELDLQAIVDKEKRG